MFRRLLCAAALLASISSAAVADAEGELRARWRGVWALTRSAVFSECTDHYTDNDVLGDRVTGAAQRFAPGEPVVVSDVDWTLTGLKVRLELAEPYRVAWTDGPYTLHEQRRCRVELRFPRSARPNAAAASTAIAAILQPAADLEAAQQDPAWNRRRVEALPADWERTRREYDAWKAAQVNVEVSRKLDQALEQAERVVEGSEDNEEYAAAFLAGLRERRYESFSSCASALDASFYVRGSNDGNRRGWEDGQRLAWSVKLAAELRECFVAVPPPAGP